ncbi:MAG TPA: hypothetical protein ENN13_01250 [Candidatus Altiarchaeales archaeon]|nr:hypothetical protein [Candidatus Altiarchaeales archaeon]
MDCFARRGVKKIFSLARTKIRLAKEADTIECVPAPLPLVEMFFGEKILTVEGAESFLDELRNKTDFDSDESCAKTGAALADIVEGVKYKFEPAEFMCLLSKGGFQEIEERVAGGEVLNIFLMDETPREGVNLYVGYDPPAGYLHLGRVATNVSWYLDFAFRSSVLSDGERLLNTRVYSSQKTLIQAAVENCLKYFSG